MYTWWPFTFDFIMKKKDYLEAEFESSLQSQIIHIEYDPLYTSQLCLNHCIKWQISMYNMITNKFINISMRRKQQKST